MNRSLLSYLLLVLLFSPLSSTAQWAITPTGTTDNFFNLEAVNDQVVYGFGTTVVKSTDGGTSWSNLTVNTVSSWIQTGFFVDAQTGWVGGKYGAIGGEILKTTDGGASWISQDTVLDIGINDIFFLNAQMGWAASFSGKILYTSNGGTNWTQIKDLGEEIEHIQFVSPLRGWAISYGGNLFETSDAGQNWTLAETNMGYGMHFINPMMGWLTGKDGEVYHTADGGNNWLQQTTNYNKPLTNIYFADALHGWAVGGVDCRFNGCVPFQGIIGTSDGGQTWSVQTHNGDSIPQFNDVSFGNSTAFASGNNGQIIRLATALTSIDDSDSEVSLSIYPNPAREMARIAIPASFQGGTLQISSMMGKVVWQQQPSESLVSVDLSQLSAGLYSVQLTHGQTSLQGFLAKR